MGPLGVIEVDPRADDPFGLEAVGELVQVDRFIFERAPQAFDEDVVHAPAPAIHGDRDLSSLENAGQKARVRMFHPEFPYSLSLGDLQKK